MSKSPFQVIMLRGMEDLPWWINKPLASYFNASVFNSSWVRKHQIKLLHHKQVKEETFDQKLHRLHTVVQEAHDKGQKVIFVGISAGAGLGFAYFIRYPNSPVVHLISLHGILWDCSASLDPKSKNQLSRLARQSKNFQEMINFFRKTTTSGTSSFNHLQNKVSVTTSGSYDGIIPAQLTKPSWLNAEQVFFSTKLPHTLGIIWSLLVKLKSHLQLLKQHNN